jgi:competence protein CoiA
MTSFAITTDGKPVLAERFTELQWQELKDSYRVGDLLMPCCMTPAIPKTSSNFLPFFAHLSDECTSSPESQWHLVSKAAVIGELLSLGIEAQLEKTGRNEFSVWKADVLFALDGRQIAIEIQHSYQHLRDYLGRQERYVQSGIEAYWLLYLPRYITLVKSLSKHRIKTEFSGKFPVGGFWSGIPQLPAAYYDPSDGAGMVKGARGFRIPLKDWLQSLIQNEFRCDAGVWSVGSHKSIEG